MSPVVLVGIAAGVPLVALCMATAWLVLRPTGRAWVRRRGASQIVEMGLVALIPWVAVHYFAHHFTISIHSVWPLVGWILIGLAVFAVLVLLPLAVALSAIVWLVERRAAAT